MIFWLGVTLVVALVNLLAVVEKRTLPNDKDLDTICLYAAMFLLVAVTVIFTRALYR